MRRLFLAAGVASLAIAGAAAAKPGNGNGGGGPHGGGAPPAQQQQQGGGHGGGNPHFQAAPSNGGGGPRFQAFEQHGHGGGHGGGGFAAPQMQRFAMPRAEHAPRFEPRQMRMERQAQNRGFQRQQMRMERQAQNHGFERQQMRMQRQAQNRAFERQQIRGQRLEAQGRHQLEQQQAFARQRLDQKGVEQAQNAFATRDNERFRVNQQFADNFYGGNNARGLINGCPPGLWAKNHGGMPPGQAAKLLGAPLSAATSFAPLYALPQSVSYLYPETPDYYYRYGDGYLYQVDRNTNLIDNLLPLLAGGYLPGQYLPQPYMASYVPDYYGLNSFYPDYGDTCNRYGNGVVYEVDCATGMVEDVVPLYANGYGVGQMLPASYAYYNVPTQYRDLYYDTPNSNYWYAPGAIYQYDPQSSMITSVAALLSPGFTVGQPLPAGYDAYHVPYGYRSTYYDTNTAWYRYNNGNIYQVDPVTQVVTAIVASLLT
jgi:hypothetical protein